MLIYRGNVASLWFVPVHLNHPDQHRRTFVCGQRNFCMPTLPTLEKELLHANAAYP
jgi:hypothetical protein